MINFAATLSLLGYFLFFEIQSDRLWLLLSCIDDALFWLQFMRSLKVAVVRIKDFEVQIFGSFLEARRIVSALRFALSAAKLGSAPN